MPYRKIQVKEKRQSAVQGEDDAVVWSGRSSDQREAEAKHDSMNHLEVRN
jgi:hypothetical protein